MAYQTFQEYNQTGLDGLFTYAASTVPSFIPLLLFALFSITLLATYFSQKRLTGRGDFISSFATSGYLTVIVAFFMSLVEGLINRATLIMTVAVAIIATILLLTSRD